MTVRRSELATFRRYETAAAEIMERYGGEIEHAYGEIEHAHALAGTGESMREIHVVRFPDDAAFAAYRRDPDLLAFADDRERAILATETWPAEQLPRYR